MTVYVTLLIEREGKELPCEVEFKLHKGSPQTYWEPEDPTELELIKSDFELTDSELASAEEAAYEKASEYSEGPEPE